MGDPVNDIFVSPARSFQRFEYFWRWYFITVSVFEAAIRWGKKLLISLSKFVVNHAMLGSVERGKRIWWKSYEENTLRDKNNGKDFSFFFSGVFIFKEVTRFYRGREEAEEGLCLCIGILDCSWLQKWFSTSRNYFLTM